MLPGDHAPPAGPRHRSGAGILLEFPTAKAIGDSNLRRLARHRCGRRTVGATLARELIEAARASVGRHQDEVYGRQVRFFCEDMGTLARTIRELESDLEARARQHELALLLSTIDGIGTLTAAHIIAEVGDPAAFRSAAALASYVGVVPGTKQSGRWQPGQSRLSAIGNARLRRAFWMPTLSAVRCNPLAHGLLPAPAGQGQTAEGRPHRRDAQAACGRLQRGEEQEAVRASRGIEDLTVSVGADRGLTNRAAPRAPPLATRRGAALNGPEQAPPPKVPEGAPEGRASATSLLFRRGAPQI